MKVTIELNGMPRDLTGSELVELEIPDGASYRDVVGSLGRRHPLLIGILIAPQGDEFLSSNMFVRDGDMAQPAMLMDEQPRDGEHLAIISPITGG